MQSSFNKGAVHNDAFKFFTTLFLVIMLSVCTGRVIPDLFRLYRTPEPQCRAGDVQHNKIQAPVILIQ